MSGLLGKLMSQARKADIGFGVHPNCVVLEVSNKERKTKEGEKITRNCYTKFGQMNDAGTITAEREISWFNIDNKSEYAFDNLKTQLTQMTAIVDAVCPVGKKDKWEEIVDGIFAEELEIELDGDDVDATEKEIEEAIKDKETCNALMQSLGDAYVKMLDKKVGEASNPVRFKVVYEKQGKYLQQPRYGVFVEPMDTPEEDSILKITKTEDEYYQKSLNQSKPKPKTKL